jgi:hypothetical protein
MTSIKLGHRHLDDGDGWGEFSFSFFSSRLSPPSPLFPGPAVPTRALVCILRLDIDCCRFFCFLPKLYIWRFGVPIVFKRVRRLGEV